VGVYRKIARIPEIGTVDRFGGSVSVDLFRAEKLRFEMRLPGTKAL